MGVGGVFRKTSVGESLGSACEKKIGSGSGSDFKKIWVEAEAEAIFFSRWKRKWKLIKNFENFNLHFMFECEFFYILSFFLTPSHILILDPLPLSLSLSLSLSLPLSPSLSLSLPLS